MSFWKFSVVSKFSNMIYEKNENLETPEIYRKLSKSKGPSVNALMLLENC